MAKPSGSPCFCFAVPNSLENDRVKLVPFFLDIHGDELVSSLKHSPQLFDYIPYGPFKNIEEFRAWHEFRIGHDPTTMLFAVYDKTKRNGGSLAGYIGYLNASVQHLCVEVGHIVMLPAFQRTHVTSNAVGLLIHYALDMPSQGGLGLRRVVWQAHALNDKSIKAANRLGFKLEGILRFDRIMSPGKPSNGNGERAEDPKVGWGGRDTVILGLCWDDWEAGGKEHLDAVMARTA